MMYIYIYMYVDMRAHPITSQSILLRLGQLAWFHNKAMGLWELQA